MSRLSLSEIQPGSDLGKTMGNIAGGVARRRKIWYNYYIFVIPMIDGIMRREWERGWIWKNIVW